MEDIARIGFAAETTQLVGAKKDLEALEPAAKKAEQATDNFAKKMKWAQDATGRWRDEFGKFVPKVKLAEAGIDSFERKSGVLGSRLKGMLGIFGEFSAGFLGAFGGIGAFLGFQKIIGTLSNFEYEMSTVAAVSGATGKELESLRDTAKELGATTEFSASQAAGGLKLLVQAGYDANDAIATLPAILNLATTEAMDLGAATEYVNSIMAGFGLSVSDAGRVTDVLVYASNAASTGVAELGEGMKYIGPISKALGISIEDTAAAMGLLSDAGLKGSMAGTSLRASLAALASPTKMAVKELDRIGVAASEVNPTTNSIVDIVNRLSEANLSAASAFKIFGREAAPAFLALIDNKEKLAEMTDEMANVQGEAQRIADYMRNNFKGSIANASSALEAMIIAMGDAGLTAALRSLVDGITAVIGGITWLVETFGEVIRVLLFTSPLFVMLGNDMNTLLAVIAGVAGAYLASFIPAILSATAALVVQAATFYTVNGGLAGMAAAALAAAGSFITLRGAIAATGFGAIAIAIGLAVAKVLDLKDELGSFAAVWEYVARVGEHTWQRISNGAQIMLNNVKIIFKKIDVAFTSAVNNMRQTWASFIGGIVDSLPNNAIGDALRGSLGTYQVDLENMASFSAHAISRTEGEIKKLQEANESLKLPAVPFEQLKKEAWAATTDLSKFNVALGVVTQKTKEASGGSSSLGDGLGDLGDKAGGAKDKVETLKTALEQLTEEFNKLGEPFSQASSAFDALDKLKENGIISNDRYVESLARIQAAFLATGGSAEQWANIVGKNTETVQEKLDELGKKNIGELGDAFIDLAVEGKASFADLAKSIIKDLLRIAWQALVVKPLLGMLGIPMAKGGVVDPGGVQPFAKGGAFTNQIVNSPTPFKFAQGGGFGLGVMGEAGAEAVMPLTRGPDGSLGVQMYGGKPGAQSGGGSTDNGGVLEVRIITDPSPMFEQYVETTAQDTAVQVTSQAIETMNDQLPARVAEINRDPHAR